jgi:hypothetical protein
MLIFILVGLASIPLAVRLRRLHRAEKRRSYVDSSVRRGPFR